MKALEVGNPVGFVVEAGHPQSYYTAAAPRLADRSAPLDDGVRFFVAAPFRPAGVHIEVQSASRS
jgi:hypothetical protein